MKYYKDENNVVYAYESDGSQDDYIPATYIAITEQEADELRLALIPEYIPSPKPTKEELLAQLQALQEQINNL